MNKILLCGEKSFAAKDLFKKLKSAGFIVDSFSRGTEHKQENHITGDVFKMTQNPYLSKSYDMIINFIIIKNQGIEENIRYIKELDAFCAQRKISRLLHISSISVYSNDLLYVNEETEIESSCSLKGEYAAIKIAIDQYLLNKKTSYPVTLIRPGYIVSSDMEVSFAGIGKILPLNLILLLGNKKTSLPLIERSKLQDAIIRILETTDIQPVYLMLENKKGTKYQFLRSRTKRLIIPLPKFIVFFCAFVAKKLSIISEKQGAQIKGLFKETHFDSTQSEKALQITF